MTYTIDTTNNKIVISSTIIDDFVDNQPSPGFNLYLTSTYNCGTETDTNILFTDTNLDTVNKTYSFSYTGDGIFYFSLEKRASDNSVSEGETECVFVDETTKCSLIAYLVAAPNSDVYKFYQALTFLSTCSDCVCEDACLLYNRLAKALDPDNSSNINLYGCDNCGS